MVSGPSYPRIVDQTLPLTPGHLDCHLVLLEHDIPFIENVTNLSVLTQPRVFVCALPIPARGLDGFPLRVITFE